MNRGKLWWVFAVLILASVRGQQESRELEFGQDRIIEKGAHHRVIERVTAETTEEGEILVANRFVQIESGLHYVGTNGQWELSVPEIRITETGAEAVRGQHKVWFSGNAKDPDAITLELPDGRQMVSHVFGLGYTDLATGKAVLIAEVKAAQGYVAEPNKVLYLNAFTDLHADLQYTYTKFSFTQDVILHEAPPAPEEFGLASETTRLEVWTEFLKAPVPSTQARRTEAIGDDAEPQGGSTAKAGMDGDERVDFGSMRLGEGRTVWTGASGDTATGADVLKSWVVLDNRTFLVEAVPVRSLGEELHALPQAKMKGAGHVERDRKGVWERAGTGGNRDRRAAATRRWPILPATPRLGQNLGSAARLNLDYTTLSSGYTNFTFAGDTTYFVTGPVTFAAAGTTTFEGGTVIKFANTNTPKLVINSAVAWGGSMYRPVVLTAAADQSVGEKIWTNALSGYYADTALYLDAAQYGGSYNLANFRIAYATNAIVLNTRTNHTFKHAQFVNCLNGIVATNAQFALRNALLSSVRTNLAGSSASASIEHLTSDVASWLNATNAYTNLTLTNCVLAGVTNIATNGLTSTNVIILPSGTGVFETLGAGAHYLTHGSPYRNVGTVAINAGLLSDLRQMTTIAPLIWTSNFTSSSTLAARSLADSDPLPALGYHYPVLDYMWSSLTVSNTTLVLTNGVAVGIYGNKGLTLQSGGNVVSEGLPWQLNRLCRYNAVQEQSTVLGVDSSTMSLLDVTNTVSVKPSVKLRFTDVSLMADSSSRRHWLNVSGYPATPIWVRDGMMRGTYWSESSASFSVSIGLTNTLWERVYVSIGMGGSDLSTSCGRNNLIRNSTWSHNAPTAGNSWEWRDNFFENSYNYQYYGTVANSHNAYLNSTRMTPTNAADIVLGAFSWATGPLGNFYQSSTNLIDRGSRAATTAALYQFTTQANQTKEATSQVDIGLHYVATSGSGSTTPADTDGDLLADYVEDGNGSGSKDAAETDWTTGDTDNDGESDFDELAGGTDPNSAASVGSILLGSWRFNYTQTGDQGQTALDSLYATVTNQSWEGYSLKLTQTNGNVAMLSYGQYGPNGRPNLASRNGTVRLWFRPNWLQGNPIVTNAAQPAGPLLTLEGSTPQSMALRDSSTGTALELVLTNAAGSGITAATASLNTWGSNMWHQLAATYSPTNVALYSDGVRLTNVTTTALTNMVPQGINDRIYIGGDKRGFLANGWYDVVETYNYPMSSNTIAIDYRTVATQDSDGDSLTDLEELRLGYDPYNNDMDGDGMTDGWEVQFGLDPQNPTSASGDPDHDGLTNLEEFLRGGNPWDGSDHRPEELGYFYAGNATNLININFGDGADVMEGPAAAGSAASDYWNTLTSSVGQENSMIKLRSGGSGQLPMVALVQYGPFHSRYGNGAQALDTEKVHVLDPALAATAIGVVNPCEGGTPNYGDVSMGGYWDWECYSQNSWIICLGRGCPYWWQISPLPVPSPIASPPSWVWPEPGPNPGPGPGPVPEPGPGPGPSPNPTPVAPGSGGIVRGWRSWELQGDTRGSAGSPLPPEPWELSVGDPNCVYFFSGLDPLAAFSRTPAGAAKDALWYPAFDLAGDFGTNTSGVVSTPMFHSFLESRVDAGLCDYEKQSEKYWEDSSEATAEIVIDPVPPGDYYLYLYSAKPNMVNPLWRRFIVNSRFVDVPCADPYASKFYPGLNFARVFVQPHDGEVRIKSAFRDSLINGLQLVRLTALAAPIVTNQGSTRYSGSALRWGDIPSADGYVIARATNGSTVFTEISRTGKRTFADSGVDRSQTYRYRVKATNELGEGPWSEPVSVSFTGGYTGKYPVALLGIDILKYAYKGSPFTISAAVLQKNASISRVSSESVPMRFIIEKVESGTADLLVTTTNGTTTVYTNIAAQLLSTNRARMMVGPGSAVRWTPRATATTNILPALTVRAFDGFAASIEQALVQVEVKSPTALYWWGDHGHNAVGDGAPSIWAQYGHEAVVTWGGEIFGAAYSPDPGPVYWTPSTNGSASQVTNVVKIVHDGTTGLALLADGGTCAWGEDGYQGVLGNGRYGGYAVPPYLAWYPASQTTAGPVTNLADVVDIAAGSAQMYAVKGDGTVWTWGADWGFGTFPGIPLPQRGWGPQDPQGSAAVNWPVQIPGISDIHSVVASPTVGLGLSGSGLVWWWGRWGTFYEVTRYSGSYFEDDIKESAATPTVKELPGRIKQVAAGWNHFLALTYDGAVYSWGMNDFGQVGATTGTNNFTIDPVRVASLPPVKSIAAGANHSVAVLADGTVWEWGYNGVDSSAAPRKVKNLAHIVTASTSGSHALAVDEYGGTWGWGYNARGELGRSVDHFADQPNMYSDAVYLDGLEGAETVCASAQLSYGVCAKRDWAPRELAASVADKRVTLSWRRYPGATSYRIKKSASDAAALFTVASVAGDDSAKKVLTYTDANVENYNTYYYAVSAIKDGVETGTSVPIAASPIAVPGAVATLTATTTLSREVDLSWPRATNALSYEIWRRLSSEANLVMVAAVQGTNGTMTFRDVCLPGGLSYAYNIRAVNQSGAGSFRPSETAGTTTTGSVPAAPNWDGFVENDRVIKLMWTPSDTPVGNRFFYIKGVELTRSGTDYLQKGNYEYITSTADTNTCFIPYIYQGGKKAMLQNGHYYKFKISAADDRGEGPESDVMTDWLRPHLSGTPPEIEMSVIATGNRSIYLQWSGVALSYIVTVSGAPGCFDYKIVWPDENGVAEVWFNDLTNGTAYEARISQSFENYAGNSDVEATPVSNLVPLAATLESIPNLTTTASNNRIRISWSGDDPQTTRDIFSKWRWILQRRDNSGVTNSDSCARMGEPVWMDLADGSDGYWYNDTNVVNGVGYRYQLVGISPSEPSGLTTPTPWPVIIQVTNLVTPAVATNWIVPTPTFPTNTVFTVTATDLNAAVLLSWNNLTNAHWYQIWEGRDDGGPYDPVLRATNATSATVLGLENGKPYYFIVTGVNTNEDYFHSAQVIGHPDATNAPPSPDTFRGSFGDGRIVIDWDPLEGADYYLVYTNTTTLVERVGKPQFEYPYVTGPSAYQIAAGSRKTSPSTSITVQPVAWTGTNTATYYEVQRSFTGSNYVTIATTERTNYVDVRLESPSRTATYVVRAYQADTQSFVNMSGVGAPASAPTGIGGVGDGQGYGSNDSAIIVTLVGLSTNASAPTVIYTPTNLVLRATVTGDLEGMYNASVDRVEFYANGVLLGSTKYQPYEFAWVNPSGTAAGLAKTVVARMVDTDHRAKCSASGYASIKIRPELAAYKTSAVDLSLGMRGVPIAIARSYDSRNTSSGMFGRGWMSDWDHARITLPDLSQGWTSARSALSARPFDLAETADHRIQVSLPSGELETFQPGPDYSKHPPDLSDEDWDQAVVLYQMDFAFYPVGESLGDLQDTGGPSVQVDGTSVATTGIASGPIPLKRAGAPLAPTNLVYTGLDGTSYEFGSPTADAGGTNVNLWLLSITNRYQDWVRYDSEAVTFGDGTPGRRLTKISSSTGRSVSLFDGSGTHAGYWCVNDPIATNTATAPVVRYRFSTLATNVTVLSEVHKLTERSGTSYDVTKYEYTLVDSTNALLARVISPEGVIQLENTYTNDGSLFLLSQMDALGVVRSMSFGGGTGDQLTVTNAITAGATSLGTGVATYSRKGELTQVKDENSQTSYLGYDEKGRVSYTQDPNGNFKSFEYDWAGRVVAATDEAGNTSQTFYDENDQVSGTMDALGHETVYEYYEYPGKRQADMDDPEGTLQAVTDANQVSTQYHYNRWGQMTSEGKTYPGTTNALLTTSTYDANGNLQSVTDPLQRTARYAYDLNGNRTGEGRSRTTVDRSGSPALVTQTITNVTVFDAQGRVRTNQVSSRTGTSVSDDPGTQVTITAYGANGKPSSVKDPLSRVTQMAYDARGNLIETIYPDLTVSRTVYDALGKPVWTQERCAPTVGSTNTSTAPATQTIYDTVGRVVMTKRWDAVLFTKQAATPVTTVTDWQTQYRRASGFSATQYCMTVSTGAAVAVIASRTQYDPAGRVQFTMDPLGHVTGYGYDTTGKRTTSTNYTTFTVSNPIDTSSLVPTSTNGVVTFFGYDRNGNQTTVTDALGRTTVSEFDALGRLTAVYLPTVTGEAARVRRTGYDFLGNRVRETDEAGIVTAFGYDAVGQLTSVTNNWVLAGSNPTGIVTAFAYDEVGNQTNQVDALNRKTTYEYDGFGRRIRRNLPGAQYETFSYDAGGQLLSQRTFNGLTITNAYSSVGRLAGRYNGATELVTYGYDSSGRRLAATNSTGVIRSLYDYSGRLTNQITPAGILYYSYDSAGNLLSLGSATANGVTNSYSYDALNRLVAVVDKRSNVTNNYTYDGVGNLQIVSLGNGITNSYGYDCRNRLTNVLWAASNVLKAGFTYTLGITGNRTSLAETNNGVARTYSWAYDALYRLTNEVIAGVSPTGSVSYTYDLVGNRTSRAATSDLTSVLGSSTPNFDVNDQLDNDATPSTTSTNYSAAGSLVYYGTTNYVYDWAERLTNVATAGLAIYYDADDHRVKKVSASATNLFLVATINPTGYAQVVEELSVSGGATNCLYRYVHGLDLLEKADAGYSPYYYLYDGLGSTRALAASDRSIGDTFTYDAYGTLLASSSTVINRYRFAGEEWDSALRMYYLRARYMQEGHGRFLTRDSYEGSSSDPASLHKYLYCQDNPVDKTDPSGRETLGNVLVTSSIIGGLSGGVVGGIRNGGQGALVGVVSGAVLAPLATLATIGGGIGIASAAGISTTAGITTSFAIVTSGSLAWNTYELFHAKNDRERVAAGVSILFTVGGAAYGAYRLSEVPTLPSKGPSGNPLPVSKEQVGALLSETMALRRGEVVVAREVTVDTASGVRVRVDLVTKSITGKLRLIDAKFGPGAKFTDNQKVGYPEIGNTGGKIVGGKLEGQSLPAGSKLEPMDVLVDWW